MRRSTEKEKEKSVGRECFSSSFFRVEVSARFYFLFRTSGDSQKPISCFREKTKKVTSRLKENFSLLFFFNNFHALLFFLSTSFHRQAFFFFSSSARYLQECGAFDVVTVGKRWNHKGKKWRGFHRLFLPFSLLFLII